MNSLYSLRTNIISKTRTGQSKIINHNVLSKFEYFFCILLSNENWYNHRYGDL